MLAGCLLCGSSIWIEDSKRIGEMALQVLPKALKVCLPGVWVRVSNRVVEIAERSVIAFSPIVLLDLLIHVVRGSVAFVISLSSLLTAAACSPGSLRGLSCCTLAFIMRGPNTSFWERKQQSPLPRVPPPAEPLTPNPFMIDPGSHPLQHNIAP